MRGALFAMLALWSATGAAQTMYKCTDAQRRITYSNVPCDKQGLQDAGPVANRITSMPMDAAPKGAAQKPPAPPGRAAAPAKAPDAAEIGRAPAKVQTVNPLVEKLLK